MSVEFVAVVLLVAGCALFAAAARWSSDELHRRTSHLRRRQLDALFDREEGQ